MLDDQVFDGKTIQVSKPQLGLEENGWSGRVWEGPFQVGEFTKKVDSEWNNRPRPCYHTISHPDRRLLQVNEAFLEKNKDFLTHTWIVVARRANSDEMEIKDWLLEVWALT